jgi:hypothetical protein
MPKRSVNLLYLILLLGGCQFPDDRVIGTWEFIGEDDCIKNPLGLALYSYPSHLYGHKIYIDDSIIYNPSVHSRRRDFPIVEHRYRSSGKHLFLENGIVFEVEINADTLLSLKQDECRLIFKKVPPKETLSGKNITKVLLLIKDWERLSTDSLSINRSQFEFTTGPSPHKIPAEDIPKYVKQAFRLVDSIHSSDLNKIFDEKILDTEECTLYFFTANGEVLKIVTYGRRDTPFEVKTLLSHFFKAICC